MLLGKNRNESRAYKCWKAMRQRCYNSNNPQYENYGGRGIQICAAWNSFERFYEDMGECPEGYSIERIDNDSGYEKSNCKWLPRQLQARNTRKTWFTEEQVQRIRRRYADESITQRELARQYGVPEAAVNKVVNNLTWR